MSKNPENPPIQELLNEVKDLSDQLLNLPGEKYQRQLLAEELLNILNFSKKRLQLLKVLVENKGAPVCAPLIFKSDFKEYEYPLSYLPLPIHIRRKLMEKLDINCLGELVKLSPHKITSTKGFNKKDLFIISMALQQVGLQLDTRIF
jgi:hypothetical protein